MADSKIYSPIEPGIFTVFTLIVLPKYYQVGDYMLHAIYMQPVTRTRIPPGIWTYVTSIQHLSQMLVGSLVFFGGLF